MPSVGGFESSLPTTGGTTAAIRIKEREGGGLRVLESGGCEREIFGFLAVSEFGLERRQFWIQIQIGA